MSISRSSLLSFAAYAVLVSASSLHAVTQNIVTERYDNNRNGANLAETQLTTANVNSSTFGKLWSYTVSGSVFASPLYVSGVNIPNVGTRNVLYVATMNDVLYAFDADSSSTTPLWSVDFTKQVAGATPVPIVDAASSNSLNIVGNVGIESTPVIDAATNTLYLVARTKESGKYFQRLHAIDITTGAEKFGGPTVIQGSVPGTGAGSVSGTLSFDPLLENQRSSLGLANGQIYISWASHEDLNNYHGWVMSYSDSTLQQTGIWCSTPNGYQGGIWMAGWAPSIDASGNVYYISGNGTWDGNKGFGESLIKFGNGTGLPVLDYFTPDSWSTLNGNDKDFGSSGNMLIPGTDLVVGGGKSSIFYVTHTGNLGHEQTGNGQIVQSLAVNGSEIKGGPVYWNRSAAPGPWMYVWAEQDYLKAYHFNGTKFDTPPASQGTIAAPNGSSSGVLTLSANGSTAGSGIIWSSMVYNMDGDHGIHPGILRAVNADDLTKELWNSKQNAARDDMGNWPKYSLPTVVNGRVYMGSFPSDGVSSTKVSVYGLLGASAAAPTFSPAAGSYASAQTVTISDATPGATIYYTTDNSTPTSSSPVYSGPITVGSSLTIQAIASASGASNSPVASASYVIGSDTIPQTGWTLQYVDSQETTAANDVATNAFDGNSGTYWHTQYTNSSAPLPHEIQINLGASYSIGGFTYLPRQDGCTNGYIGQYEFYVSSDGVNWGTPVATGTFDYGPNFVYACSGGTVVSGRDISFPAVTGSYVRLRALTEMGGNAWTSMAELNLTSGGSTANTKPQPSTLSFSPATVSPGSSSTGTVVLNQIAPAGGTVVTLSSNNTGASVPASVTVAAGGTTATFTVTTTASSSGNATITATANSASVQNTLVMQVPTAVPTSLTLNPTTVTAASTSKGTITLNRVAPSGGTAVALSSSYSGASVPASVTVLAGATTATFTVTTTVNAAGSSTISAAANGTTVTATLTINAGPPTPASVTFSPTGVSPGGSSTGTVKLTKAAPTGGLAVTLASNNAGATVPASVTVAAGATSATFAVTTTSTATGTATITATANGKSASGTLGIGVPTPSSLTLSPAGVTSGSSSTGKVTLNIAAPGGGQVVTLAASNSAATVPASVTVAAGATTATFPVTTTAGITGPSIISATANGKTVRATLNIATPTPTTLTLTPSNVTSGSSSTGKVSLNVTAPAGGLKVTLASDNAGVTVPASVTVLAGTAAVSFTATTTSATTGVANISATANGSTASGTLSVQASGSTATPVPASVSLNPNTLNAGSNSTGKVTLNAAAPAGGVVVTLASSSAVARVPATVTVAAGATSASFTINTTAGQTGSAAISATANSATASAVLTVQTPPA